MVNLLKSRILFILLASTLLLSCSSSESSEQKATKGLEDVLNRLEAVSIGAVVVKDNQIVYTESIGYKNMEQKIALQDDDVFRIASISKSFVATGLLQLVDKDLISLDDDVSKLIGFDVRNPIFPDKVITLRMILSHTSSLTDAGGYYTLDPINPAVTKDVSASFNNYEPGSDYEYCNLGYNIAGTILEKVSRQRFDEYIVENIFNKLGIYGGHNVNKLDSNLFVSLYGYENGFINNHKDAYASRNKEIENYILGYSTPLFSPTGGVKVSPTGLANYMMMHMNYGEKDGVRLISEVNSKAMQTPVENTDEGYGLALRHFDGWLEGVDAVGHTGSAYGTYSVMFFNPKEKWGIVAITNGYNLGKEQRSRDFLKSCVEVLHESFIK